MGLAKLGVRFLMDVPRKKVRHGIAVGVYIVSFWLSKAVLNMGYTSMIGYFLKSLTWSLVRAGVIFIFVYMGFALQKQLFSLIRWLKDHVIATLLITAASGLLLIPFTSFEVVDYHLLKNGIFILDVLYGSIGTLFIVCLAVLITRCLGFMNRLLAFIGKNSVHFMCSEYFGMMGRVSALFEKVFGTLAYIKPISFAVYFPLLCLLVKFVSPLIEKIIGWLVRKAESIRIGGRR